MNDQEKRKQLAQNLADWNYWQGRAVAKGWKLPGGSPLPNESWIAYWQACQRYEDDPTSGRPVIPHRSGGGQLLGANGDSRK